MATARFLEHLGPWKSGRLRGSLTVMSFDGQWLKLVNLVGGVNSRKVSHIIAFSTVNMGFEDIVEKLKKYCTEQHMVPETVLVANPSHLTTARLFTLPSSDPKEIKDIVQLQAEKHTPYAREEILTDFKIIESTKKGYTRVMLIVTHKDVVHRSLRIVKEMGWTLERVGFELEGLLQWLSLVNHETSKSKNPVLLAELHDETANLVLVHQGKPYFHRSVSLGINQLDSSGEVGDRFLMEVARSLEAFEAEGLEASVSDMVITGQVKATQDLTQRLKDNLKLNVHVVPALKNWKLGKNISQEVQSMSISLASLVGMAGGPGEVDLTPPALKLHRTFEVRAKALMGLGGQVIGILVLLAVLFVGKTQASVRYLDRLKTMQAGTSVQAQELELTLKQLQLIDHWRETRGEVLRLLTELNQLAPDAVQWNTFTYSKEDRVLIRGVSNKLPSVFDYVSAIEKAQICQSTAARRVAKRIDGSKSVTDFELVCNLKPETDEEEE